MYETDPGVLSIPKMELAVTIINGSPIYAKSPVLARTPGFIIYIHLSSNYPHYCYPVKFPALAMILLSFLYLFASKAGTICTRNSINNFLSSLL